MSPRPSVNIALVAVLACACSGKKSGEGQAAASSTQAQEAETAKSGGKEVTRPTIGEKVGENRWMIPMTTEFPDTMTTPDEINDHSGGGMAKKRRGETPVYVDGEPRAMMRYSELPPWVKTRWLTVGANTRPVQVMRFNLVEYLEAIGVDVGKVHTIHAHGGRGRVAVIDGKKLRKVGDEFMFSFSSGEGGKARFHWIDELEALRTVDKVRQVAIYIDKPAPAFDPQMSAFVDSTGQIIDELPYVKEKLRGGVRVLRDAQIATVIKRKRLFEDDIEPTKLEDGTPHFVLFDFLAAEGVKVDDVASLELLSFNDIVARLDGPALTAAKRSLQFSAPPKSKGHVLVHLPGKEPVEVTAISLFSRKRASASHARSSEPPTKASLGTAPAKAKKTE